MELAVDLVNPTSPTPVLKVVGSVDLQSKQLLLDSGRQALSTEGVAALALDLSQVDFLDSMGIGALVELSSEAEDAGVAFGIRDPSARVQRILEVTGLSDRWAEPPTD